MALEQEIKLTVLSETPCDITGLMIEGYHQSDVIQKRLISRYFDTPDKALLRYGVGLRLRCDDQQWFQTVKESGSATQGLHQRREWEYPIDGPDFDLMQLRDTPVHHFISDKTVWPHLQPLFTTDFQRQIIQLHKQESHIELAYDFGHVYTDQQTRVIHEVELELITGDTADLTTLAQQLMTQLPLALSNISKAQMGYELLTKSDN